MPKCPICSKPFSTIFTCPECWPKIPAQQRQALGTMRHRGQDTTSKLASVVRKMELNTPRVLLAEAALDRGLARIDAPYLD